jgi:peptidoglycan/LPS O-acetylase OafA/YrhL
MSTQPAATAHPSPDTSAVEAPDRFYFPELDGLRFIAFLLVYLFHAGVPEPLLVRSIGRPAALAFLFNGGYGVQLFFILSGYLITSLLLREEARYGRISLRAFWVRRILRIWPLYYLIIAIGFGVLPPLSGEVGKPAYSEAMRVHFVPFLLFLGNWTMAFVRPIAYDYLSILWSVCVEEQFYLFVPVMIAFVAPRFRIAAVVILMAAAIGTRWICASRSDAQPAIVFNTLAQFDTILSGVLLALVLGWDRNRPRLRAWLRWLQWPLYILIVWGFCQRGLGRGTPFHRTWDLVGIWLCGVAIIMVAVWGAGWLRTVLSYSRVVWLGKISYGLYMYHEIPLWARRLYYLKGPWFANREELLAIACLALTIALAAASYHWYERRFLELKRKWTRVPSRPV